MDAKDLPTLNKCVNRLTAELLRKQDELYRRENSCGTAHDVHKMTQLRRDIASLEKRLRQAELLQEEALRSNP